MTRLICSVIHGCYLDDSNGAAVANRAMMEALGRRGLGVQVLSSTVLELGQESDPEEWLRGRGVAFERCGGDAWMLNPRGLRAEVPLHYRATVRGVPVTLHRSQSSTPHIPEETEREDFLGLFDAILDRQRPDVLINYGGDRLAHEIRSRALMRGIPVVFPLHNFNYRSNVPFSTVDYVVVPSQFAADHYRQTIGLDCTVLTCLVDKGRALALDREPTYLTFVNPSREKGVFPEWH